MRSAPLQCKPALFGPTCIFCHRVLDKSPAYIATLAAEMLASDSIAQDALQAAADGKLQPPPAPLTCPLCSFAAAGDSGCPACGASFYRVVRLRDPEGQVVAAARPEVVAAARRIKRALLAEADRAAGIDTSTPQRPLARLDEVRAELDGELSMSQAERLLREDLPPLLAVLARVRELVDEAVARKSTAAQLEVFADIRDLLYPGLASTWQIPADIPDAPPACPTCGKPMQRATVMSAGQRPRDAGDVCLDCSGLREPLRPCAECGRLTQHELCSQCADPDECGRV
jgi:hypothetical protein